MLLNDIKKSKVWSLAIHIVIGNFNFGYSLGVFNTCADNVAATLDWGSNKDNFVAIFSTMIPVGALFGSPVAGYLCEKYGRRGSMIISSFIFALGCALSVIPLTETFAIGRFLCGVSSGLYMNISPMFLNEITPDSMTSQMGPMVQISGNASLIFAYGFGLLLPTSNYSSSSLNDLWIFMFLFPGVIAIYQIIYFWFFMKHDSPKWYLDNNQLQEAKNALLLIYTEQSLDKGLSRFSENVEMQTDNLLDNKKLLTFKDIFQDHKYRKMLRIGFMLGMIQQLSGICANIFYSTATFKKIGGTTFMARIYTVIMGVINFIAGYLTIPLLKRFGRKTLMLAGSGILAIDCFILGIFSGIVNVSLIIPLLCIYLFIVNFAYSLGATLWTYLAEVCVDKVITVSATSNLFFTCVVTISFPYVANGLGISSAFFFFAGTMAITFVYFYWELDETKGKTKPEIMRMILNKS